MTKIITNAMLAIFHGERAKHFAALAERDSGIPVTLESQDYLAAVMGTNARIEAGAEEASSESSSLDFLESAPEAIAALPAKAKEAPPAKKPGRKAKEPEPVPARKAGKKPAKESPESNGHKPPKDGLRKGQITVLEYLAKQAQPATRSSLKAATKVGISEALGRIEPETRPALEESLGYPSLLSLGYAKLVVSKEGDEGKERTAYIITAAGRKALEKARKASK